MKWDKISSMIALITGEFAFGVVLSLIFFGSIFKNDDFLGNSYGSSIFKFYGILNIIFFVAVLSVGIFGAVKLQQSRNIKKAVLFAVLFWLLSLVIYVMTESFLSQTFNLHIIPLYIILVGIIIGFNIGLNLKSRTENDVR